jgi:hypothetical protein
MKKEIYLLIAVVIVVVLFILLRDDLFTVQNGGSWCFDNPKTDFTCLFEVYS